MEKWLALASCLAVALVGLIAWPFTVDDAYILFDFAESVGSGQGYSRGSGGWTDGVTSPLWLALLALASSVGIPTEFAAKLLGLGMMGAGVWLFGSRLAARADGLRAGLFYFAVIAPQPFLGIWGVAGLETGFSVLLVAVACTALDHRPAPRVSRVGVAIGALAWLRPECALLALALLVGVSLARGKESLPAWYFAGFGALSLLLCRWLIFGDALPLSWHAKPGDPALGMGYVARGMFLVSGVVGLASVLRAVLRGGWRERTLGGAFAAHAVGVCLAGGDWMPGARLLVPVIPLYAYLFALGLRGRRWRRVGVVYCGLAVAIPCVLMVAELPKARAAAAVRDRVATPFATWLGERYERVALVDVGYLARQGGFEAIDLGGLTDREFAHLPGGHLDKQISGRSLAAREPEALVLHSAVRPRLDEEGRITRLAGYPVEMRLAADPWVRRHFRCVERIEYHAGYFYAVLERRSD